MIFRIHLRIFIKHQQKFLYQQEYGKTIICRTLIKVDECVWYFMMYSFLVQEKFT